MVKFSTEYRKPGEEPKRLELTKIHYTAFENGINFFTVLHNTLVHVSNFTDQIYNFSEGREEILFIYFVTEEEVDNYPLFTKLCDLASDSNSISLDELRQYDLTMREIQSNYPGLIALDSEDSEDEEENQTQDPGITYSFLAPEIETTENDSFEEVDGINFWENNEHLFSPGKYKVSYNNLGIEKICKYIEEDNQNEIKTFKNDTCLICVEKQPNILFCNCGHLCMCNTCFKLHNKKHCPVCKNENTIIREI